MDETEYTGSCIYEVISERGFISLARPSRCERVWSNLPMQLVRLPYTYFIDTGRKPYKLHLCGGLTRPFQVCGMVMAPSSAGGSCCTCTRVKSWTTRVTMACFFLAEGIEFSVILPTMWDYLRGLGGQEWLYGLSLAAFSISNLFTSPLYGFVFDKTHRTKLIVLFAGLFQIGGNL